MSDDRRRRHAIKPRAIELIAIVAKVDPRTVRRVLDGRRAKSATAGRVREAVEQLATGRLSLGGLDP